MLAEAIDSLASDGMSQSEIARKVGLDKSVISRLARGQMLDVRFSAARRLLELAGFRIVPPTHARIRVG